jgi:hypothetical protein
MSYSTQSQGNILRLRHCITAKKNWCKPNSRCLIRQRSIAYPLDHEASEAYRDIEPSMK